MNRVVHFELLSSDPERTAAFYANVFGWRTERAAGDYWRLVTGEDGASQAGKGINGATVRPMNEALPVQTVNTVQVSSLDEAAERVTRHGGRLLSEVIALPNVGRFQYCADPHGLPFGIIEYSP